MSHLFMLAALAGVFIDNIIVQIAPLVLGLIYIVMIGPGAFSGGNELDKEDLIDKLGENWRKPDELATFIKRYWCSIKYVMSAQKRGANCSLISLASFALGGWYFYADLPMWLAIWSGLNGLLLWLIGNIVNKAMFILQYEQGTPQWKTACVSFVALSEIHGNENYSYLVNKILPEDKVSEAVKFYQLK